MNYFKNNHLIPTMASALALTTITLHAGEHTVGAGEFEQVIKFDAVAMPDSGAGYPVSIKPAVWKSVKIEKFLAHGSAVKKGEQLLWIDTEDLDKRVEETSRARVKQQLELEKAELELTELKASTKESLEKADLEYERFKQDYDYYKKVTKPQHASDVEYDVTVAKDYLSYSQEELDQLLKMYDEDGLTEETEEIIIQRVKNAVINSQRKLKKVELGADFDKKVSTPRNDADWQTKADSKKRKWELAKKNLPLALKIKELDLAKLRHDDKKAEENLAELKADRALMEFKSPADGVVYFGEFKDGKWISEPAAKVVRKGGDVPARMTIMTVVPDDAELKFNAFFSEKQMAQFQSDHVGHLRMVSNPWKSVAVKPELVSESPTLSHEWLVSFSTEGGFSDEVLVGSKANVTIVTSSADDVLSIPVNAVKTNPDGTYSVRVKMAEGDPKVTNIELGRQAGDKLEVLNGLENGQVILTP
ncbi:MAG: hypothetical protein ACSHX6_16385 [Akkermansiaceae bacterium]